MFQTTTNKTCMATRPLPSTGNLGPLMADWKAGTGLLPGSPPVRHCGQNESDRFSTEALVPRIGDHLVAEGYISPDQLHRALQEQAFRATEGSRILLGQLLVEMGFVSKEDLDRAVAQQVMELHNALRKSNLELENRVEQRTRQLQQALSQLSELNQLKVDFVANVSHELRTPLALMVGYVDLLGTQTLGALNEDQAKAVAAITAASKRLRQLIEDLLLFSTVHDTAELKLSPITLEKPARSALQLSLGKANSRQISLLSRIRPRLPEVLADNDRICWVIGQFLDNAIKFTPPGGKVGLLTETAIDQVTVAVADTGIGMPQERIEEVFIPFHQLDGSSTRRSGGTGIGLALAQQIIRSHGSTIEVNSRPGKGSRFAFSLPISA